MPPPSALDVPAASRPGSLLQQLLDRVRHHNTALLYTGSSVLVSACTMIAGICMVRWIAPADIGLWQSVRLAVTYSMFALAGVNNGLSRELPFFMGKSDERTSRLLAGTTLMYVLGACVVVLLGGVGSLFMFRDRGEKVLFAIAAVTASIIFTFYTYYLIVTFRSSKSFADLSKVKLAEGCVGLASIVLLFYFGYNGMLLRVLLIALVVVGLMHLWRPIRVSPAWDAGSFWLLLKTGAPIFALDYLANSAATCDRLVLLKLGGVQDVGYYSMALLAREAVTIVPSALSEYIYPRMSFSYGQDGDPRRLWRMAVKSSLLVVAVMIPIAIAGWFLLPPVVTRLFPKYTEGVTAAQWLLVAAVFSGATLGKMAIWSLKAWRLMVWYQVLGAILVIAGPIIGSFCFAQPLVGVSVGLLAGQVLWLPIAWYLIYLATHRPVLPRDETME